MTSYDVAVAGEAIVDLVATGPGGPYLALPGGSPANVAVGLARLGVPTRMLARVSGDAFGRTLREHLEVNGVDTASVVRAAEASSLAIVHHGADGYDLRIDGTADWQWTDEETAWPLKDAPPKDAPSQSAPPKNPPPQGTPPEDAPLALHVGSLAMVVPPGADVLARLARRARTHATVSYDPNCRPAVMERFADARERVEALMRAADIVKISDADLEWLRPGADPERFAGELLAAGVSVVAVTRGPAGSIVTSGRCPPRHLPAYRTTVVDTVGAGDSYMSTVLAGLRDRGLLGADRREALRAATAATLAGVFDAAARAAALTCARHGADPPTRMELDTFDTEGI